MIDEFKKNRKLLRRKWTYELRGKDDKTINRRIVRKKMKHSDAVELFNVIHG